MKKGKLVAISYIFAMAAALLTTAVSFAEVTEDSDAKKVHSVVTLNDYEARARNHEDAAKEMQTKAQEQKRLLEQYKAKSYLYGRQAQDLQGHAHALARKYDNAAKAHIREAESYRGMAIQLAEDTFCAPPTKTEHC
ncbi:hypothetical protein SAMN05216412_10697 [Nitrosospira multiformis]|uniref:Uncharacterized protein n=1 Tax=Nitrosospira multiformis TaxID=1231 RepID=A0A1I0EAU0_9PROT|nr:hypothetical protein [Nitrosospira multiformis]SET42353.1 hypothetical protein SAMN05216412_10697 [Nitrosospira multiformis]